MCSWATCGACHFCFVQTCLDHEERLISTQILWDCLATQLFLSATRWAFYCDGNGEVSATTLFLPKCSFKGLEGCDEECNEKVSGIKCMNCTVKPHVRTMAFIKLTLAVLNDHTSGHGMRTNACIPQGTDKTLPWGSCYLHSQKAENAAPVGYAFVFLTRKMWYIGNLRPLVATLYIISVCSPKSGSKNSKKRFNK